MAILNGPIGKLTKFGNRKIYYNSNEEHSNVREIV